MTVWERNIGKHLLGKVCISCFTAVIIHLSVINPELSLARDTPDLSGYLQTAQWTCGPAALRVILSFYDAETTEDKVAILADTDLSGTTLYGLYKAARAYGLEARGERWNWARLAQEEYPVIAYVGNNHYVVVLGIKDGHIDFFDPAIGQIRQRKEVFELEWRGEVLAIHGDTSSSK